MKKGSIQAPIYKKDEPFPLVQSSPPLQLSGCILYAPPAAAPAIFVHICLLCNGTCYITGGGGGVVHKIVYIYVCVCVPSETKLDSLDKNQT